MMVSSMHTMCLPKLPSAPVTPMACAKIAEQARGAARAQQQFERDRSTCTPARWALWKSAQKRGGLFMRDNLPQCLRLNVAGSIPFAFLHLKGNSFSNLYAS
jgi:hypothetical protein